MANLETIAPARTFKDLLNVHDGDNNEGIEAGLKVVQDGEGVASALSLSETEAKVTGDFAITGELSVDSIDVNGVGTTGAGNIATTSLKVDDHLEAGSIETQGDLTVGDNCEIGGELEAQGAYFHGGVETTTFEAENVATLGDGSTLKSDAAPTADAEIANKKYVDDQVGGGGSATSLSTGNITATTYGITSDGGVDDVVLAEADTNNSGVLGSAKWDEIVVNTAHSGGDGSDHADVATNTSHSGGDGSDHADVATNTSHSGGDGSDHADVATNTLKATCDTTNVKSALNASLGGAANIGDANDTVTFPGKGDATGNFRVLTASDVYPTSGQGLEVMVNSGTSYILNGTRDGSNISAYHPIRIDGSELGLKISGTEIFSLYSSGLANFKEDLLINGDLEVDGAVEFHDDFVVSGETNLGNTIIVDGAMLEVFDGSGAFFQVDGSSGDVTINGDMAFTGDMTLGVNSQIAVGPTEIRSDGSIETGGDVLVGGDLDVTGAAAFENLTIGPSGSGWLKVNSLKLDGHEISTTDVDGNLILAPNGNGEVRIENLAIGGEGVLSNTIKSTNTNGDIILAPDGTGLVRGLFHQFCHNSKSDIGTTEYYLAWSDDTDATTAGNRTAFQTMYDMTLKKFTIRMGSVDAAHNLTLKVERVSDGDTFSAGNTVTIASATIAHDGTNHKVYSFYETDFNVEPRVMGGDLAILTLQADVDPQSTSNELYMSSMWTLANF